MAINLGSAYGKVSLDTSGLLNSVKQGKMGLISLAETGKQVGASLKQVGQLLTIGLTLPILAIGAASIKAASDFEETKNKAVVVFGEMSDSIVENSNRAAQTLGVSKKQYLDYASSIGAALTAGGMGIQEATELSEQAVKHFADLASFHNTQVEDAALAWQSAIRGQFEPIQKYFPFITNQYLLTYGTANGLISENTTQLTANQRAIILNAIALDEKLNPALNDFSETSDGLANSQRILKAQFQDSLVMLGENLLPIALQLVHALNGMLEAFNKMQPFVQKAIIIFAALLAMLGPILTLIGTIITFISSIAGFASTLAGMGISLGAIATAAGTAGTAIVGFAASAILALWPVLLIIGALVLLYLAFKNNFLGITTTAKQLWFIIKYYFMQGWNALITGAREGLASLQNSWNSGLESMQARLSAWADWLRNAWQRVLTFLASARNRIVETFRNLDWGAIGRNIIMGIVNGMLFGIPSLISAAIKAAKAALDAIKKTLGIHSASTAARELGDYTGQGYIMGLQRSMDPNVIARMMARPVQNMNTSSQQNVTLQLTGGLTVRQAREMIEQNNNNLMSGIARALGGA